jgi:hypothetical protein
MPIRPTHRYRFRLHGYDGDWVDAGASGERDFSQLPPGDYRLDVAAGNADGAWSAPAGLRVRVLAPWWRQPWALLLWAAAGVLLLVLLARAYRARLRERNALLLREEQRRIGELGSEAKSHFLATLGHEIRTPMTGVLGMAELLQGSELAPRQRAQVEAIHRAGEHLLRLVNDALDLARIEAGRLVLEDAPFDLQAVVEDSAALLRPLAQGKGLAFELQRAPGAPRAVRGDAGRVRQILFNLGSNAIKFTDAARSRCAARRPGRRAAARSPTPGRAWTRRSCAAVPRFEQAGLDRGPPAQGSGLGPGDLQGAGRGDGRRDRRAQHAGRGHQLPRDPAAACGRCSRRRRRRAPPRRAGRLRAGGGGRRHRRGSGVGLLRASATNRSTPRTRMARLVGTAGRIRTGVLDLRPAGHGRPGVARLYARAVGRPAACSRSPRAADARAEPDVAAAAGMHGFLRKPVTSALLQ